jgi:hypothetical protein
MEKEETTTVVETNTGPIPLTTRSIYHTKERVEILEEEVNELQEKFTLLGEKYVTLLGFFKELCDGLHELQQFQLESEE